MIECVRFITDEKLCASCLCSVQSGVSGPRGYWVTIITGVCGDVVLCGQFSSSWTGCRNSVLLANREGVCGDSS